jgi:hypothetical protein
MIAWHHTLILHQEVNLENQKKLKNSILIRSPILIILSNSTLHSSFIQYRDSEFPLSLRILWNSLWLRYSEFLQILLSLSSNFEVDKLCHSVQIRISSSHLQISETITAELLARFWCMSNCRKFEKVSYNVGIESFLILYWIWGQKFRFLRLLNFAQDRNSSSLVKLKIA